MTGGRELDGRVAIVTGAARNIGRAIAIALAEGGAAVSVVTRSDAAAAEAVAFEIRGAGGQAEVILTDITQEDDVTRMLARTLEAFGRLDILVNNAALRKETAIEAMSFAEWRQVIGVALDGPFLCCRAAAPHLAGRGTGAIINIGGLTAYTGARSRAHVVAAKAGLDGLTKALAHELADRGVTVNLVSPGLIDTVRGHASSPREPAHHQHHATLVGRRGEPAEVAAMVRYLAGPNARYITGQTVHVNGGAYLP
jgi:3-oxoacyl-[acyl-carrier protein] reductase